MEVVLASKSPRRLQLLQAAGFAVEVRPGHVDETPMPGEAVEKTVQRLCQLKAGACSVHDHPVIAADTLVAVDGKALGQPADMAEAKIMLQQLSGREHQVFTAVCVRLGENTLGGVAETRVRFRALDDDEIDVYLAHNEVLDKAGAYAIQAGAASFIEAIEGPMDNVIGLPVVLTKELLMKLQRERDE
ncbi:MAG: Maf family protein [Mariprofundaceae bacterium]|nr:Maf family protein [Mariprofundaceae bacterium]